MTKVVVRPNEHIEGALRKFKRAVEKSGILSKARRCQYYEKPSIKRKRRRAAAVKRHLKRLSRETLTMNYRHEVGA